MVPYLVSWGALPLVPVPLNVVPVRLPCRYRVVRLLMVSITTRVPRRCRASNTSRAPSTRPPECRTFACRTMAQPGRACLIICWNPSTMVLRQVPSLLLTAPAGRLVPARLHLVRPPRIQPLVLRNRSVIAIPLT